MKEKELRYNISAVTGAVIDNAFWFVPTELNILCRLHLTTGNVEIVSMELGRRSVDYRRMYFVAAIIERKIILAPEHANDLLVYNIDSACFEEYQIEFNELKKQRETRKYRSAAVIGNNVWLMPNAAHSILKYDTLEKKITLYRDWFNVFCGISEDNNLSFGFGVAWKQKLFFPWCQKNGLVEYDTKTDRAQIHFVGNKHNHFMAVECDEDRLWLIDNIKQEIRSFDCFNEEQYIIKTFPAGYGTDVAFGVAKNTNVMTMKLLKNKLCVLPHMSNYFFVVDTEKGKVEYSVEKTSGESFATALCLNDYELLSPSQTGDKLVRFNAHNRETKIYSLFLAEKNLKRIINCIYLREKKDFLLKDFINMLDVIKEDLK